MSELMERLKTSAIAGDVERALAASNAERERNAAWKTKYDDFDRQINQLREQRQSRTPTTPKPSPRLAVAVAIAAALGVAAGVAGGFWIAVTYTR